MGGHWLSKKHDEESGGKDVVALDYVPNDWLALVAYANWDEGEADSREAFQPVYALKMDLTFESVFLRGSERLQMR